MTKVTHQIKWQGVTAKNMGHLPYTEELCFFVNSIG